MNRRLNLTSLAKGVTRRPAVRRRGAGLQSLSDSVAVEEPLEIRLSGEPLGVTMRTPGEDVRLAIGFLFSEGILKAAEELSSVAHCGALGEEGYGNVIDVTPAPGVVLPYERVRTSRRGTLTTSACGVCGRASVADLERLCGQLPPGEALPLHRVLEATTQLGQGQANFVHTGGVHAAAALDARGAVLACFEDVGRHNAVDKVVGALVQEGRVASPLFPSQRPPRAPGAPPPAVLAVSGRASFEIVQKAAMARIPVVASVSAASSLAIDLAQATGVTLCAFVRGAGLNVYTHPERIRGLVTEG